MAKKKNGRDVAINILNKWFDEIGLEEDKRKEQVFTKDELEFLNELPEADRSREAEKIDVNRERLISAIQSNLLVLGEDNRLTYTLADPPLKSESKDPILSEIKFKHRYQNRDMRDASMNVDMSKDEFGSMAVMVAVYAGKRRVMIDQLYDRDMNVCLAVVSFLGKVH